MRWDIPGIDRAANSKRDERMEENSAGREAVGREETRERSDSSGVQVLVDGVGVEKIGRSGECQDPSLTSFVNIPGSRRSTVMPSGLL